MSELTFGTSRDCHCSVHLLPPGGQAALTATGISALCRPPCRLSTWPPNQALLFGVPLAAPRLTWKDSEVLAGACKAAQPYTPP